MILSIVIPAYNEEKGIEIVLTKINSLNFPNIIKKVEVIVVDNNSTDSTHAVAEKLGAIVIKEPKQGYGAAYKSGITSACGDIVVTLDADDTYPVLKIPELINFFIENNSDFLIASRFIQQDKFEMPFVNKVGNLILTTLFKIIYGIYLTDSQSGMWLFKKRVWENMHITSDTMAFSEEIKIEALFYCRLKYLEYAIPYYKRVGKVKLNLVSDGFNNLYFLIKKRFKR